MHVQYISFPNFYFVPYTFHIISIREFYHFVPVHVLNKANI